MKHAFYFILILFLFFVSIGVTNQVFFSNTAIAEQVLTSNSADGNSTKATLSNDLKLAYEQTETNPITGGFLTDNWGNILIALLGIGEVITRLVPSVKDNSIFNFFIKIINAVIPNLKKSGGTF